MKKSLLSALMLASLCANAQILVNESFEGTSIPAGFTSWRNESFSQNRVALFGNGAGVCDGAKSMYINMYDFSSVKNWYVVYSSTESNGTDLNYSFKYTAKPFESHNLVDGAIDVDYSIDGGTTWINLLASTSFSGAAGENIPCTEVSGTIPGANIPVGANFKMRIHAGLGNTLADFNFGIDDFKLEQMVTALPDCAVLSAPVNGETLNSITPTITYAPAQNAASYKISVGTTPGGTNVINNLDNARNLSYTVPTSANLEYNKTYYVTVTPTNALGDATGCQSVSFNTGLPACPDVTRPNNGATNVSITPTIEWTKNPTATGYYINVGTTPGGTDILNNVDAGNVRTYQITANLAHSTTYYYSVMSYAGGVVSDNCEVRSFTTIAPPPANDACATATEVTTFPYNFTQTDATSSTNNNGFITVCSSSMNDGVWYKFVGDGTQHTVTISNVDITFDPKLQIYSGDDCSSLTCVVSRDSGNAGFDETITFPTTMGTTYYAHIGHYSGTTDYAEGNFTIDITKETLATAEVKNNAKAITITPNPFVDEVFFHGVDVKKVAVLDASGRTVKTVEVEKNSINLGGLKSGMYILLLTHKDGTTSTVKAIKK